MAVTDERFEEIRQEMMEGRILEAGLAGAPSTRAPAVPVPLPTVVSIYQDRLAVLNHDYEMMVAYLKHSYPLSEVITWTVQRNDAVNVMAWLAEDETRDIVDFPREIAPFLYDLATSRTSQGIAGGLLDLAQRVLSNDAVFSPALAATTARRHGVEKQMLDAVAADDREALKAITWSFAL